MKEKNIKVETLDGSNRRLVYEAAALLHGVFASISPNAWPTFESAVAEVEQSLSDDRISIVAASNKKVIGWIGGIRQYNGNAYELHPLVVDPSFQRQGIGSMLVEALEAKVHSRGAMTIYLGSDDEQGRTSLSGIDLYPDVLTKLKEMRNLHCHPYEFYLKKGFSIVGVVPDANGYGKPDIIMAKRVTGEKNGGV